MSESQSHRDQPPIVSTQILTDVSKRENNAKTMKQLNMYEIGP